MDLKNVLQTGSMLPFQGGVLPVFLFFFSFTGRLHNLSQHVE